MLDTTDAKPLTMGTGGQQRGPKMTITTGKIKAGRNLNASSKIVKNTEMSGEPDMTFTSGDIEVGVDANLERIIIQGASEQTVQTGEEQRVSKLTELAKQRQHRRQDEPLEIEVKRTSKEKKEWIENLPKDVSAHRDLTAAEISSTAQKFCQDLADETEDGTLECVVVVIMSHGANGYICGSDGGEADVEDILQMFNNENASHLKGIPRIFIFNHCRDEDGNQQNNVPKVSSPTTGEGLTWEDMLIINSTVPRNSSFRNIRVGSWLIDSLCEAFMKHACELELADLLFVVNRYLDQASGQTGYQIGQSCAVENRHFKKLYFNP